MNRSQKQEHQLDNHNDNFICDALFDDQSKMEKLARTTESCYLLVL